MISGTNTYASESIDAAAASIWKSVGDDPAMKSIPRSMAIKQLLMLLAEGRSLVEGHKCEPRMFDREFRWLRVKAKGEMTVEHADEFYYHVCGLTARSRPAKHMPFTHGLCAFVCLRFACTAPYQYVSASR